MWMAAAGATTQLNTAHYIHGYLLSSLAKDLVKISSYSTLTPQVKLK
jgi:hypothetical protein